jgi:hypothetical protein
MDPQFGIIPTKASKPLTAFDLQAAALAKDIKVVYNVSGKSLQMRNLTYDSLISKYVNFIAEHSRFVDVPYIIEDHIGLLMLYPSDRYEPLLFQGIPMGDIEYTTEPFYLYAPFGKVHLKLDYDYRSNSNEEPLASPSYLVTLTTSSPWVRAFYACKDEGEWQKVAGNKVDWKLHPGANHFKARAETADAVYTETTDLVIYFGHRAEARILREKMREERRLRRLQTERLTGE